MESGGKEVCATLMCLHPVHVIRMMIMVNSMNRDELIFKFCSTY